MTPTPEELLRFQKLSPALKQVAALVALGNNSKEISYVVGVREVTARAHKKNLYKKTGLSDAVKLAVFIVRHPQIEKMLRESL